MRAGLLGPRTSDCTEIELDGCVSVHCPRTGEVQLLDASATAVWRLLDGTRTLSEVVAELHRVTDADSAQLRADVQGLVDRLRRAGALQGDTVAGS